jgi:hypothetical protein
MPSFSLPAREESFRKTYKIVQSSPPLHRTRINDNGGVGVREATARTRYPPNLTGPYVLDIKARVHSRSSSAGSGRFALPDLASRYASRDAAVTPGRYRGFDEQEPTSGEGGESERFIACDIHARSNHLPGMRLRGAAVSRANPAAVPEARPGRVRLLWPRRGRGCSQGP